MKEDRLKEVLLNYINSEKKLPWNKGFVDSYESGIVAGIGASGKPYNGFNWMLTAMAIKMEHYDSRMFLTFQEIKKRNGSVKAGEKAWPVAYAVFLQYDEDGNRLTYTEAKEKKKNGETVDERFAGYKLYYVFNMAQTTLKYEKDESLAEEIETSTHNLLEKPEALISRYMGKPEIRYANVSNACYRPGLDIIEIPPIDKFQTGMLYYSTLFHELVHSTGAPHRLNRCLHGKFGSKNYAKEELVAELGASILMNRSEFDEADYIKNNAAYLQSWVSRITKADNFTNEIFTAWNRSMEAVTYMLEGKRKEKAA